MNNKIVLILFVLIGLATSASAQRRTRTSPPAPESVTAKPLTAKPPTARLMVQGTYEETFQGTTSDGHEEGSLVVKFEAARWLKMETNEAGHLRYDVQNGTVMTEEGEQPNYRHQYGYVDPQGNEV